MAVKKVAIRLQPQGGAEVVSEFKRTEVAGVQAAKATQTATESAITAADRQIQKLRDVAQAATQAANASPLQAQIDRITGISGGGNARADIAARSLFAGDDESARRAAQLRAEIDPLGAALDRYNRELAEMDQLQKRGHLSTTELARGQELAKTRLDATTAALNRQTGGLTRQQLASRLNLTRQGADVFTTAAMGMNPAMIAIQQGPQVLDALATSGIKAQGALVLLGGAFALSAAAGAAAFMAWKSGEDAALQLERAVSGLGRTSGLSATELEVLAITAAEQGEVSIRSARDQAAAYVQTGKIGGEVIGGLIAIGKDYAAVMGLDAEDATQALAKAMAEPDKAARELTRQMGLLDQVTLDHIDTLVKSGDRLAAQKILLEALTQAVDGQADRIGGIESAWDGAARAVSNYWDALGRALYTTPNERLASLDQQLVGARNRETSGITLAPGFIDRLEAERATLLRDQLDEQRRSAGNAGAADNQAAQEATDRARSGRSRSGGSGAADREARERLQRERQEQDRAAMLELEMSRAIGDVDHVRALEDEAALRTRIRQLVDDDVEAGAARTTALREQGQLLAARAIVTDREGSALFRANVLEIDRIEGMARYVVEAEKTADLHDRINAYLETGTTYYTAWLRAAKDQLLVEEARAGVLARIVADADREHRLTLARLAGREGEVRLLERQERIDQRASQIESQAASVGRPLNRGQGTAQAEREIDAEDVARATGMRREWVKGFIDDIRKGDIRDALASQFESAADRLIDKLIDGLFDLDWGSMFKGGGGGGGGAGGWISSLFSAFTGGGVGRNAAGTDYWSGGWTWVGEEGPELIRAPRGAQIASNTRSMQMASGPATQGGGPVTFVFSPTLNAQGAGPREVDVLSARLDAMAASLPTVVPQIVQDAMARRIIR